MNDISSPSTALEEFEADSPFEIRRRVADIVRRAVDADAAAFARYSLDEEGDYFTSIDAVGDDELVEVFEKQREEADTCCPVNDPRYPPKEADQQFEALRWDDTELGEWSSDSKTERRCPIYETLDIGAEASALLYDGSYFLGWLGVFAIGDRTFSDSDIETLDALVDAAVDRLVEAEEREIELLDDKPAWVLVNPKLLEVECATGSAFKWLTDERKDELLDELDGLAIADSFPIKLNVDGYAVWVTHMAGKLGMRLLATVERSPPPEKQPDSVLTPRQREVVGYAAAGATNREIAETLGITPDTVSDHLSEAYDRLDVANRVELALTLTQPQ